jgi:hypothetical protein
MTNVLCAAVTRRECDYGQKLKIIYFFITFPFPEVMSMTGCQIWQKGPSLLAQQIRIQQGECSLFTYKGNMA